MGTNTVNLLNDAAATCGLTDYTFCDEFVGILNDKAIDTDNLEDILDEIEVTAVPTAPLPPLCIMTTADKYTPGISRI